MSKKDFFHDIMSKNLLKLLVTSFTKLLHTRMPYVDIIIVGHIIETVKNPIETDCR